MLSYQVIGTASKTIVIAHGLFGSGRNWRAIAKRLSENFRVITVDMRNHANSFWSDQMTYFDMADDLAAVIRAEGGKAHVLGHSMGGKAAMILALRNPELLEKLVVADISPEAYGHSQMQYIDAMETLDLSDLETRSQADAALAEYIDDSSMRSFFLQSLEFTETGARWKLNHKALRNGMTSILGWPEVSGRFDPPCLFVTGAQSNYVSAKSKEKIRQLFPKARYTTLKNAGHWLHADQPKAFAETVGTFCQL